MAKLPSEMIDAGYEALKQAAVTKGYGWEFGMVSEADVDGMIGSVFDAMLAAAPEGWVPESSAEAAQPPEGAAA
jgi:hypothetical protein